MNLVFSNTRTVGNKNILSLYTELKNLNMSNTIDLTRLNTTVTSSGTVR